MRAPTLKGIFIALKDLIVSNEDRFLWELDGVVHVGGSFGQEIKEYKKRFVKAIWIEANPDSYKELLFNIKDIKTQIAIQELVTDVDDCEYAFNVSRGSGVASSIFDFHEVKEIWDDLSYRDSIKIRSKKLDTILNKIDYNIGGKWGLVIDTQGSELLVLKGARELIKNVRYIKLEAADFEAYRGGCTLADIKNS
jgi:FkbM family methyltransferase